jgi:hypothetical protein
MKFTRFYLVLVVGYSLFITPAAFAAIQFGSSTQQASFAASSTQQVGNLLNSVVSGSGSKDSSTTIDTPGIIGGISGFFNNINTWLNDKAGIDFYGILKGIGHFFLIVIQFLVGFLKKVL